MTQDVLEKSKEAEQTEETELTSENVSEMYGENLINDVLWKIHGESEKFSQSVQDAAFRARWGGKEEIFSPELISELEKEKDLRAKLEWANAKARAAELIARYNIGSIEEERAKKDPVVEDILKVLDQETQKLDAQIAELNDPDWLEKELQKEREESQARGVPELMDTSTVSPTSP